MSRIITIDDTNYNWDDLSDKVKECLTILDISQNKIRDIDNFLIFLKKAREVYVDELRTCTLDNAAAPEFGID